MLKESAGDRKDALMGGISLSLGHPGNFLAHDFAEWKNLEDC